MSCIASPALGFHGEEKQHPFRKGGHRAQPQLELRPETDDQQKGIRNAQPQLELIDACVSR